MLLKTSSLSVRIAGMGTYLPKRVVTNAELEASLGIAPGWIEKRTGILERRYNTGETAVYQAAQAIRHALDNAGGDVTDVDMFVGASSGPQQLIPCNAALVQRELNAPEGSSFGFDLNATCLSFPVALHTIAPLVASGAYRCVVVFSTEIASRSLNPNQKESAVLFGDGAAAAVIVRTKAGESSALHLARFATHSSGSHHTTFMGAGSLHHPNDPTNTPAINQFDMNGPAVFLQGARLIAPFLDHFFADLGVPRAGFAHGRSAPGKRSCSRSATCPTGLLSASGRSQYREARQLYCGVAPDGVERGDSGRAYPARRPGIDGWYRRGANSRRTRHDVLGLV